MEENPPTRVEKERLINQGDSVSDNQEIEEQFYGSKSKNQEGGSNNKVGMAQQIKGDQTPPMSPGKRILRVAGSPGRFVKAQLREGSIKASIFSLVIICLGAGTLTIPNIYYLNGYYLGTFLIILGASISAFTGYLIAYCCHKTRSTCYEEVAMATYGKSMQTATSICMILCNLGFIVSYFVLFKTLLPYSIELAMGDGNSLPKWCGQLKEGQMTWAIIFGIGLIPVSLPRKLTALRYTSAGSVMLSIYVMLVIVFECLLDRGTSPSVEEGFSKGDDRSQITVDGIFNSLPLIIFAYMYQINIPAIYSELDKPDMQKITRVIVLGTIVAAVAYILAGIFGYVAFAADPRGEVEIKKIFASSNILQAPYKHDGHTPIVMFVSLFGMCLVVLFAAPFCVLPTKDSIEEVSGKKFTKCQNVIWTLVIIFACTAMSLPVTSIGTIMAFLGATTNSAIGFLLPIIFYLHVEKKSGHFTNMKVFCYLIFVFICCSSVIELYTLFSGSDD